MEVFNRRMLLCVGGMRLLGAGRWGVALIYLFHDILFVHSGQLERDAGDASLKVLLGGGNLAQVFSLDGVDGEVLFLLGDETHLDHVEYLFSSDDTTVNSGQILTGQT